MLARIERDTPAAIHLQVHAPVVCHALDGAQLAVRDLQVIGRRGELDPVACRERLLLVAVKRDTLLPAWVVSDLRAIGPSHRDLVSRGIDALHAGILTLLQAGLFGIPRVEQHVVEVVALGPGAVGPGEVLPGHKNVGAVLFLADQACTVQLGFELPD